jgi:formate dehydrogenase major subunit
MAISRRDVLKLSLAGGGGTALGGLIASGVNLAPVVAQAQELRIKDAKVTPSVCPFCSVGCATLVHTVNGQIVNIEGDSRSPHNEGTLCPKGAATFQLHVNPNRPVQVLHRAPGAGEWEVWDLNRAMDRVAELVKKTRDVHRKAAERQGRQRDDRHLLARRRHPRHRVEPHPPEADARPGHHRDREPGPDMT